MRCAPAVSNGGMSLVGASLMVYVCVRARVHADYGTAAYSTSRRNEYYMFMYIHSAFLAIWILFCAQKIKIEKKYFLKLFLLILWTCFLNKVLLNTLNNNIVYRDQTLYMYKSNDNKKRRLLCCIRICIFFYLLHNKYLGATNSRYYLSRRYTCRTYSGHAMCMTYYG